MAQKPPRRKPRPGTIKPPLANPNPPVEAPTRPPTGGYPWRPPQFAEPGPGNLPGSRSTVPDGRMPDSGRRAPQTRAGQRPGGRRRPRNFGNKSLGKPGLAKNAQASSNAYFPAPQPAPPAFMPHMPEYEAGLRGLQSQYMLGQQGLQNQLNMVAPQANLALQRLGTDKGYATNAHNEGMALRGLWDSSVNPYLLQRDVQIPYGRQEQDIGLWGAGQYGDLYSQLGQLGLGNYQGWNELLLNNIANAVQNMPYNVPQYSQGQRALGPCGRRRKPKKKNKKSKPRRK